MKITDFLIDITSDQPDEMRRFYREVLGLPPKAEAGPNSFTAGGGVLHIDTHSETKGKAKEPSRFLIDFFVESIDDAERHLEEHGVTFIRLRGREEWGGIISTFLDPDGNYVQVIEYRPE